MNKRVIAVALIRNHEGKLLILKMPKNRGVFPGKWGIVGGGIEEGELIDQALRREVREEVGLVIEDIEPFWFFDDERERLSEDGTTESVYMIYLLFDCLVRSGEIRLNEEWEKYEWVSAEELTKYDLNEATRRTFRKKGWL